MSQSMVNFRMDTELNKDVEKVCADMGLSLTTAFTIYAKNLSRERRIPFEVTGEIPREEAFQIFMDGVNGFTDDFFAEGREKELSTDREKL